jgi:hypothetical protein
LEKQAPNWARNRFSGVRMIGDRLVPKLKARWPDRPMKFGGADGPLVVFPAAHPEVGDAEIHDNGADIIVSIGKFTHEHFPAYDAALPGSEREERIAGEVITFLEQLFADRIELFSAGRRGGWRVRGAKPRGKISKLLFGRRTYVWSGPLADG